MKESELQSMVADYIRIRYPDALFHSDFGSGIKLTMAQAAKQKRQNGGRRAWPDMFIAEPMAETDAFKPIGMKAYGLFIELKKEGTRLKKKNGEWASEHIAEQAETLEQLRARGYEAVFAVGFDEAKTIIDNYLKGGRNEYIQKIKESESYFKQDSLDKKFDEMMVWVKDLSRKDFNKFKKAMDQGYDTYQTLRGIEPSDDSVVDEANYMLTKEEK